MASFQISHCVLISEMEFKYSLSKNRGRISSLYSRNDWDQKTEKKKHYCLVIGRRGM